MIAVHNLIARNHRTPTQPARLVVCSKCKEMCGRILKSRNIVNFYQGMSKLKLKISVSLLQLFCLVVSVALHGEFERFGGFCVNAKPTKSLKFAMWNRNDNTQQLK